MKKRVLAFMASGLLVATALTPLTAHADAGSPEGPETTVTPLENCVGVGEQVTLTRQAAEVTVSAPEGKLISAACVQPMRRIIQAELTAYAVPRSEITLRHSQGEVFRTYALTLVAAPEPDPEEETPGPGDEDDDTPGTGDGDDDTPEPVAPFHPDWTYAAPTCDALVVAYPANIPDGHAKDVNIRIRYAGGETTLNYHNHVGSWSGTTAFTYRDHPQWPARLRAYEVVWVHVAGTNYHFGESFRNGPIAAPIQCRVVGGVAKAVSRVDGWPRGTTVRRGKAPRAVRVTIVQPGSARQATLQRRAGAGAWRSIRKVAISNGHAVVAFPREARVGTYRYRLVVPATSHTTGATSGVYTVRVRRR